MRDEERIMREWLSEKAMVESEIRKYQDMMYMIRLDKEGYETLVLGMKIGYVLGYARGSELFPMSKIVEWRDTFLNGFKEKEEDESGKK